MPQAPESDDDEGDDEQVIAEGVQDEDMLEDFPDDTSVHFHAYLPESSLT
jgi:hypothetical protein